MGVINRMTTISRLDEDADGYAGLDGEDVFVSGVAGREFLFFAVAVQVKHVKFVEAAHEAAAHPAKGGIIKIAMAGDESQDTLSCFVNSPLSQAHELYIIVA